MPAKPRNPSRPTIYLDHYILSDGSRSRDSADPRLALAIERISREANLCVSLIHAMELGAWGDVTACRAMAAWLDGLELVWVYPAPQVERAELRHLLRAHASLPSDGVRPFAPAMLSIFETIPVDDLPAILRAPTLPALVEDIRVRGDQRIRELTRESIEQFREDRREVARSGVSEEAQREWLERKRAGGLAQELIEQHDVLRSEDLAYARAAGQGFDAAKAIAGAYRADPRVAPAFHCHVTLTGGLAEMAARRAPGSRKERSLYSFGHDIQHLIVPVAHCDVVSCDGDAYDTVVATRKALSRPPPITLGRTCSAADLPQTLLRAAANATEQP